MLQSDLHLEYKQFRWHHFVDARFLIQLVFVANHLDAAEMEALEHAVKYLILH